MLLTSALKTQETTLAFQQYVLEVAGGASPHRYGALRLAFVNTIDGIKQKRQKIEEELIAHRKRLVDEWNTWRIRCEEVSGKRKGKKGEQRRDKAKKIEIWEVIEQIEEEIVE